MSLETALSSLINEVSPIEKYEKLSVFELSGRILAKNYFAEIDIPPFDRSPFDGYAVNHNDIAEAAQDNPVILHVEMKLYAGDFAHKTLKSGEAARIMTGAPIPDGATCVVKQEDTDYGNEHVKIYKKIDAFQNYCFKSEDVKQGQMLIKKGTRLYFSHSGILAAQGIGEVMVYALPKAGILTTGSELTQCGRTLAQGKIYDTNKGMIAARLMELGTKPVLSDSVADGSEQICNAINELADTCDFVVTTGGVSVGERDYMPEVAKSLNARMLFHGTDIKPGSSLMAFIYKGKPIICLSGNPFAAAVTFELFASPTLRKLAGARDFYSKRVHGKLKSPFLNKGKVRRFVRAISNGSELYIPGSGHSSGVISSLADCNCLIDIPASSPPLNVGDEVEAILF